MVQEEYEALMSEIDDVATTANFNDRKLLLGAISGGSVEITAEDVILQTGANPGDEMVVSIDSMVSGALGISDTNIATQGAATDALGKLDDALNTISTQRAGLGAAQSRLEATGERLDISAENALASGSNIADTDMAKEMTKYLRENILAKVQVSMLAQANNAPNNVLHLLM
jgi:flagellin